MKITAQEIIQEALDYGYNEERRAKFGVLDKLLDFSTFGRSYERKAQSASFMYLTNRLMEETALRYKAEKEADSMLRAGVKAVEIYGTEAVKRFHDALTYLTR